MFSPVLTLKQIREWEQASWESGILPADVIEEVGLELEFKTRALRREFGHLLILAGKGNNGADATAFSRALPGNEGQTLLKIDDPLKAISELSRLAKAYRGVNVLVVDGIFGIGLNRPLEKDYIRLVEEINRLPSNFYPVSIDVPSGLSAETGKPNPVAVQARITYTVGAVKESYLKPEAAEFVGKISLLENIGLAPLRVETTLQWSDWKGHPIPRRKAESHKGAYGHVAILAGSKGFHGAAVLCAQGAAKAQPGLITVITSPETYLPVASQLQAQMVREWELPMQLPDKTTALVAGPGLAGQEITSGLRHSVQELWRAFPGPMVVDASALDWLPTGGETNGPRVVTPHPGEAGRLLGKNSAQVQADRVSALREISTKFAGCWVVLKGHQTLTGRQEGKIYVNASGNPAMAQGGTGDILAGLLGAMLAQSENAREIEKTICRAVWKHGNAGDRASSRNPSWTTSELPAWL